MSWYKPWTWGDESDSSKEKRNDQNYQGSEASGFANEGQDAYSGLRDEQNAARQHLADIASGKVSLSSEQLRQGLQQNLAAQRSMAASASPQNAAMAARTAANNTARLGYGMSGQAATAGIQERMAGAQAYNDAIARQRAMELQQALGSRQNAVSAYSGVTPDKSFIDKWGPAIIGGIGAATK